MKTRYITYALSSLLLLGSCTDSVMDKINKDTHNPPEDMVPAKFQVTDAITSTAYSTLAGAYAWYVGSYTEQIFGTGNNQLMKAELRNRIETAASTTFNNEWNATYSNLQNIKQLMAKCSEGGMSPDYYDIKAMGEVLWVLTAETLTTLHGDIPYSQALDKSNYTPAIDKQESIYKDLCKRIDGAIADLEKAVPEFGGESNAGSQDILFNGDLSQWLAFAYAVKAKVLVDGAFRYPENYASAATAAQTAFDKGFAGASLAIFNGVSTDNSWAAYHWSRQYSGANGTVVDLLKARNDKRLSLYSCYGYDDYGYTIVLDESYPAPYAPAGDAELAQATITVGFPAWFENGAATIDYISESELHFILAECLARGGKDAAEHFKAGVKASFSDMEEASGESGFFAAADVDAYIATLPVTLEEIMVQKYLSEARDGQLYTYNDLRRCKAQGEEFIKLKNPNNTAGGRNQWPLRLPYGNSDVLSNPNVSAAFGSGNEAGSYLFTENIWLFGGSR